MRAGAEIGEFAVAVERDFFALGNVLDDVEFELGRGWPRTKATKDTKACHFQSFSAADGDALEGVVGLGLLLISASICATSSGEMRCGNSRS